MQKKFTETHGEWWARRGGPAQQWWAPGRVGGRDATHLTWATFRGDAPPCRHARPTARCSCPNIGWHCRASVASTPHPRTQEATLPRAMPTRRGSREFKSPHTNAYFIHRKNKTGCSREFYACFGCELRRGYHLFWLSFKTFSRIIGKLSPRPFKRCG